MLRTFLRISGYSFLTLLLLSGCSIQKRQYQPGLYFSWYGKSNSSAQLRSISKKQNQFLLDSSILSTAETSIAKKETARQETALRTIAYSDKNTSGKVAENYELKKAFANDERPAKPKKKKMPKHLALIIFGGISIGIAGLLYGVFLPVAGLVALGLGLLLIIIGAINSPKKVDKRLANEPIEQKPEYSDGEKAVIFGAVSAAAIVIVSFFILGVILILEIITGFN